ncbi:MAG: hypothetical protein ACI9YU_000036 [Flavobacteriales bacterium]
MVAPGVAVRSAIRNGEYEEYQGTSMASPHVTGSVLLLREAFPNVSGEEILLALYNSALDLGDVGEDNNYGNGMINVLAAFNLLSLTNTPVPPDSTTMDLEVTEISIPESELHCGSTFTPQIVLTNAGTDVITDVMIIYSIVGESESTVNWSGTLNSGQSETVALDPISVSNAGMVELWVRTSISGSPNEADIVNNNRIKRLNIRPIADFPYYENFENGSIHDGTWMIKNEDVSLTWDTLVTGGLNWSQYSLQVDFSQYNPKAAQKDELISPLIPLPEGNTAMLKFDMSYSFVFETFADSLEVLLSTDCGQTWVSEYLKGGAVLGLPDSITEGASGFLPSQPNHWRTESILLEGYEGQDILVNFVSTNLRGSHLVLDNVRVFVTEDPASISTMQNPNVKIYPNPSNSGFYLESDLTFTSGIRITDLTGRSVKEISGASYSTKSTYVDVSELPSGTYMVVLDNDLNKVVRPLVIAR